MNTETILLLIDKYFEGETTLSEERQIRDYFNTEKKLPEVVAPLKEYFLSLDKYSSAMPSDNFDQKFMERIEHEERQKKLNRSFKIRMFTTSGIAAAFILLIGLQQFNKPTAIKSTVNDPMIAMQIVTNAFAEVNKNMEKGVTNFSYLNKATEATQTLSKIQKLNEGVEQAAKVHYFNKGYKAFQRINEIPKSEK